MLYFVFGVPEYFIHRLLIEKDDLSMVLTAVACKVSVKKDFLRELAAKASLKEIRFLFLCLHVAHQEQLLLWREWDF